MPERGQALILIKELPVWAKEDSGTSDEKQKVFNALQKAQAKGTGATRQGTSGENRAGQPNRKNSVQWFTAGYLPLTAVTLGNALRSYESHFHH